MNRSHGFLSSRSFLAEGSHADNASEMQDVEAEAADITVSQVHGNCYFDSDGCTHLTDHQNDTTPFETHRSKQWRTM